MNRLPIYWVIVSLAFALSGAGNASTPVRAASLQPFWVFFTDKGVEGQARRAALDEARLKLNAHARWRRAKVLTNLVDEFDLPVASDYVTAVSSCGARLRFISRWLNAVSVEADAATLERLRGQPFVRKIRPVARYWPCHRGFERLETGMENSGRYPLDDFDYGPSFGQLELCNVPAMHARGLTGSGVRLCLLDTGFWLEHEVFDSATIIATYDFINGDSIVWNEPGQDTVFQHNHGTITLSVAAGKHDGSLYGPAFGAELILGKTEDVRSETPIEEDYYVAGLEWADGLGADVVSTSLGYTDWYTFEDMDGNTAVTTIAVDIAVSRGIVVCTAAGNDRHSQWGHIIAPADADSVIAVGAVDSAGQIAYFSSPGPTFDGRIKPEVCAQGLYTFAAVTDSGPNIYGFVSGTSLSTPIIGGICALLLEAHPDWTPMQLREALMMTASQAAWPDTNYGWGIANGLAALDYVGAAPPRANLGPANTILITAYPNPANSVATWAIEIPRTTVGSFTVTDILGRTVVRVPEQRWAAGYHRLPLDASHLSSGIYFGWLETQTGRAVGRLVVTK
jgi:serine protease AprX